jgi:hypothetical protein
MIQPWKHVLSHFSLIHILTTFLISSHIHSAFLSTPKFTFSLKTLHVSPSCYASAACQTQLVLLDLSAGIISVLCTGTTRSSIYSQIFYFILDQGEELPESSTFRHRIRCGERADCFKLLCLAPYGGSGPSGSE